MVAVEGLRLHKDAGSIWLGLNSEGASHRKVKDSERWHALESGTIMLCSE